MLDRDQKVCVYTISERLGRFSTASRDVLTVEIPIPLNEYSDVDEYVALFGERGILDVVDQKELRSELVDFIREETRKIQEERDDAIIKKALEVGFETPETEKTSNLVMDRHENFANKFSFVMRNSSRFQLAELMRRQILMMNEMNQIIRVRDWEMADIMNKCESAVNDVIDNVDVHPHELSKLNEKLRNLHASYACQIELLVERQKRDFRNMVDILYSGEDIIENSTADNKAISVSTLSTGDDEDSKGGVSESYTIYIGAQLKSMHNVRLLTSTSMVELCTPLKGVDVGSLLKLSISLYGRQLSGLVLLVPRDPLWHTTNGSEFARVCEQSTELHFEPLPNQLKDVVESAIKARHWREESASTHSNLSGGNNLYIKTGQDITLEPGDVYCTRHSNLKDVHLVFHLVKDDSLTSTDISSRHPCLNGIRNIIRLTTRLGITSIFIPLLLVEQACENMTMAWCMRRAEMVFKCVKGYLMEVCGVCGGSAVGGGVTNVPHYNINLVLPSGLADEVYQQISAMVPSIFHLVPSVSVAVQEM